MTNKVWFITGCSTGFGRELAHHTLELGYRTVVTARNMEQIKDLTAGHEGNRLALQLDVTDPRQVLGRSEMRRINSGGSTFW